MAGTNSTQIHEFGPFRLDEANRLLSRDGQIIPLPPKVVDTLLVLVENAGSVVGRETLVSRVWPGTFVDDNNLTHNISVLRRTFGKDGCRIETVPKRGYRLIVPLIVPVEDEPVIPSSVNGPPSVARAKWITPVLVMASFLLFSSGIAWWFLSSRTSNAQSSATQEIPLTSLPGYEGTPSFSPDGETIVFVSIDTSDNEVPLVQFDKARVLLVSVKGGAPRRLTTAELGPETAPAWSPAGDHIAMMAGHRGAVSIYLVSPIDGRASKLMTSGGFNRSSLSWSPDGRFLAYAYREAGHPYAVHVLTVADGRVRQITTPPASEVGDSNPAFSPDGRWIGFVRHSSALGADVYLTPASGGEPIRLTHWQTYVGEIAWMPDSNEILFTLAKAASTRLARVRIDPKGEPSRPVIVERFTAGVASPAIIRPPGRPIAMAFARPSRRINISWAELGKSQSLEFHSVAASTRRDYDPSWSPDGARIAFASNRSGSFEIWVCNRDGSSPRQLTSFGGPDTGSPRWSPDGRHIAFDAQPGNNPDIYVVEADGGPIQRVTAQGSDDARPSWSSDGKWIYFRSNRDGARRVWKIPYTGRSEPAERAQRVTSATAHDAYESPDARWLYFVHGSADGAPPFLWQGEPPSELWRVPVEGGAEEKVLDGVFSDAWGIASSGIYFVERLTSRLVRVAFSSPAVRRVVAPINRPLETDSSSFAVSRDGALFLFAFPSRVDSDLFLLTGLQSGAPE